ncbi:MAG TPA: glycosyltransferase family 9 protein [Verrucomicrobiae bacterium]|nr:glycosyltransferase family 9 protein [Verrucomicrobiae bacterium]
MPCSTRLTLPDAPRLLVARPDRVGDVIISTSCIAPIRQRFPRATLYFFAAERMRPLFDGHPDLDGFLSDPTCLAKLAFDAVIHLHPDAECYCGAYQANIPVRIGYHERFLTRYLTHGLPDRRARGMKHEAAYNFDLLALIGVPSPDRFIPSVHLPESALASLGAKLPWPLPSTPFAVVNPSAHSLIARWPAENFLHLADWIDQELHLKLVFVGADAADSPANAPAHHLNLTGRTDLAELAWLLKHARVLVTRDTGPSHLAAAVGCPVVVIFGRTTPLYGPTRWRPLTDRAIIVTKPIRRKHWESRKSYWRRSFSAITVSEVASAVQRALAAGDDIRSRPAVT